MSSINSEGDRTAKLVRDYRSHYVGAKEGFGSPRRAGISPSSETFFLQSVTGKQRSEILELEFPDAATLSSKLQSSVVRPSLPWILTNQVAEIAFATERVFDLDEDIPAFVYTL